MNLNKQILRIPLSEKILFARHLSIMIRTGMPLIEALRLIDRQKNSKSFAYVLKHLIKDVENGQFLSVSLTPFKKIFGDLFVNIVRIGESSGSLVENLEHLAGELKKRKILHQKIVSAIIYPVIILVAMLGVMGLLIFFVLPKIIPVFAGMNMKLPVTTRIIIGTTNFFLNHWALILISIVGLIILVILLMRIYRIRYIMNYVILYLPIAGSISRKASLSDLTRTMGLLLKSGVKIVEAVQITAESVDNLVYKKAFKDAVEVIKRGNTLNSFLKTQGNIFPADFSQMVEVGENTGTLENNLFYLAEFYGGEVDELTKNLSSTLEPLLLLVMGVVVGFVAVSIIIPIYQITKPI